MVEQSGRSWKPLVWGERILKVSGLLALFGYISLRAHVNFIGLSGVPAPTTQQYLLETYRFGAYVASVLAPATTIYLLILSFLPQRLRNHVQSFCSSVSFRYWIVPAITLGICAFGLRMLQLLSQYGTELAIGPLRTDGIDRSAGHGFCSFSLVCIAGVWFLLHQLSQDAFYDRQHHAKLKALSFLLVIVTLQLPILYGYYVHSTQDPIVALEVSDDRQPIRLCGLLLFDTGSEVLVWNSAKGSGQVHQIPKSRLKNLSYLGQADLLSEMQNSLGEKELSCNSLHE